MSTLTRFVLLFALTTILVVAWWSYRIDRSNAVLTVTAQNFDDYVYYYPTFNFAFTEARAGRFPFWNPYQHCGSPFFATAQHLLLYPLNVAFWFLPTSAALKLTNQLHFGLALAFTFFLARVVGLSTIAAVSAGIVYCFCPGLTQLVYLPHHLYGAAWIPLHLALAYLTMTAERPWVWGIALSVAIAVQYLGAYPMFCAFSAYAVIGCAVYIACVEWWAGIATRIIMRRLLAIGGAFVLAGTWMAPQLLPALELAAQSPRRFNALTIQLADPRSPDMNLGHLLVTTLMPLYETYFFRPHPHVGTIAIVLAALALFNRRHRRAAGFFALLTLVAILLGIGRKTPLFAIYFALPSGNWFRIADRFFILASLGLALLAGIGVDSVRDMQPPRTRWAARCALLLTALGTITALYLWQAADLTSSIGTTLIRPQLLAAYVAASAAWGLAYLRLSATVRPALLTAIPIALYGTLFFACVNGASLPDNYPDIHLMSEAVASFIRTHQGNARTYIRPAGAVRAETRSPAKSGMLSHLYVVGDRENVFPRQILEYTALMEVKHFAVSQGEFLIDSRSPNLRLFDLMGTRFVVEHSAGEFLIPGTLRSFRPVYRDLMTTVYENPQAKPRTFLVYEAEPATSEAAALHRLTDPSFNIDTSVVLEGNFEAIPRAAVPHDQTGSAHIRRYEPLDVSIEVHTPAPAYLVLTDQFYPGWEATVDRQAAPIHRADGLFRAVSVPTGDHEVTFRFVPRSFYRGVWIAIGSLLLVTTVSILSLRRTHRI